MSTARRLLGEARRNKAAATAVAFLVLVTAAAVLLALVPYLDPYSTDPALRNMPPGTSVHGHLYLFGTDQLGRDVLARVVLGGQVSLSVGVASVLVSGLAGTLLGLVAGFRGGWADDLVMRVVDLQQSVPSLLIALLVLYIAGPSLLNVILVLAVTRWMVYARLARSLVLSVREEPYVEAARSLGVTGTRILTRHVLPNIAAPLLVLATLELGVMLLTEASLSFLGLGIQPPQSSWGLMLADGREYITRAWWLVTIPGLVILLTTLSVNLTANWLRSRTRDNELAAAADVERSLRTQAVTR